MNDLQVFNNSEFGNIRATEVNGEVMFVGKDIAEILEYANTAKAIRDHVDDEDKSTVVLHDGTSGNPNMVIINESGVYTLIFGSKLPNAKKFKHWVTSEVLPSIRKTGSYNLPGTYKEALQQLLLQVEENERLALKNSEMKPKAEYFDDLVDRKLLTNFRDTAKELGVKPKKFLDFLEDKKYIYRDAQGTIKPYSDKNDGLFELKEYKGRYSSHAGQQTLITPRGREVFRLLLK